jgi:hypothetical protein
MSTPIAPTDAWEDDFWTRRGYPDAYCQGDLEQETAWNGPPPPAPTCDGCDTPEDRALFARLATEVAEYQQLTLEDA